jgi:hypothetical protein
MPRTAAILVLASVALLGDWASAQQKVAAQGGLGGPAIEIDAWAPGNRMTVPPDSPAAPQNGCRFGFSIAMTNNVAVIGAPDVRLTFSEEGETTSVNGAGAAFVFARKGDSWEFVQRLIGPEVALMQTGCSVAIDPVTQDIAVGAWGYSKNQPFAGAAFVYRKGDGSSWGEPATDGLGFSAETRMPSQTVAPASLASIDQFGFGVGIHDGTLVVGCPLFGSSNTGAVFVFERGAEGTYAFKERLQDEGGGANDQLGTKVAIHGNLMVAGSQNDDVQGRVNAGSVIVYLRQSKAGNYQRIEKLTAPVLSAGGQFGSAIACHDGGDGEADLVVIGSPTAATSRTGSTVSGNGMAVVRRSLDGGITWTTDATLLPRRDVLNNNFGYSVAITHTASPEIIVGAPGYDSALQLTTDDPTEILFSQLVNTGAAFAFTYDAGTFAWSIRGTPPLTGDLWDPALVTTNTNLGRSVAVAPTAPNVAIAGAETPTGALGTAVPFFFTRAEIGVRDGTVAGPVLGPLGADGLPDPDGTAGPSGGGSTGGGIAGGGAPGTGITSGPGAIETPLTPIVYQWGLIKGSVVALRGDNVFIMQTDGKHSNVKPEFGFLGRLPEGATFAGIGDINGDLSGDVLFVNAANTLQYWKRNGFQVVETRTIDTLPVGYEPVLVSDIDGDNKLEVVLQEVADPRQLTAWTLEGGAISAVTDYELPAGDWSLSIGALRTRTSKDLLLRDRQSGTLRVLIRDGSTVSFPAISGRPMKYRLSGVGDANADGQPDIFWQSGGDAEIDYMDQDENGNYFVGTMKRAGFSNQPIIDIRDWNDDGTVDFWCEKGRRNFVMYGQVVEGYMYSAESRDLGNAPGQVMGFATR